MTTSLELFSSLVPMEMSMSTLTSLFWFPLLLSSSTGLTGSITAVEDIKVNMFQNSKGLTRLLLATGKGIKNMTLPFTRTGLGFQQFEYITESN